MIESPRRRDFLQVVASSLAGVGGVPAAFGSPAWLRHALPVVVHDPEVLAYGVTAARVSWTSLIHSQQLESVTPGTQMAAVYQV
jgi:hypothetical protein